MRENGNQVCAGAPFNDKKFLALLEVLSYAPGVVLGTRSAGSGLPLQVSSSVTAQFPTVVGYVTLAPVISCLSATNRLPLETNVTVVYAVVCVYNHQGVAKGGSGSGMWRQRAT